MSDREAELRNLVETVREYDPVVDAWTAKSFTDRLFVVEIEPGAELPASARESILAAGLEGTNRAFGIAGDDDAYMGTAGRTDRYRFLDTEDRGNLQSYVVD